MQYTFLCEQNINKRRIYLSLFEPGHFSCQFNSKRVLLYLAKWASCDNRALKFPKKAKSLFSDVFAVALLVSYKLPNIPQGTPSSTPLYRSTFLNLCLFPKSKVANTNTPEQLSVRSHENTPQEMENTLQTGKNWKSFRTKRVSINFGGGKLSEWFI